MGLVIAQWGTGFGIAVISGWVGYLFGQRQERDRELRDRAFDTAEGLVAPLRGLQKLIRRVGRTSVTSEEVAVAFEDWFSAYDGYGHRLPLKWHHISRSVREAAGTVFGGVAFVDLRPECRNLELAAPDSMWQDFADEYLDYCAALILRWGESTLGKPEQLKNYEQWLVATERREPIGQNPAARHLSQSPRDLP